MKAQILSKTNAIFLVFVIVALTSCSFSYSMYRDCDGKTQKEKVVHPKPEWRLAY